MKKSEQIKKTILERWMPVFFGKKEIRDTTCYLCKLYLNNRGNFQCRGCPIFEKTGQIVCYGTPFIKFAMDWDEGAREMMLFLLKLFREYKKLENRK